MVSPVPSPAAGINPLIAQMNPLKTPSSPKAALGFLPADTSDQQVGGEYAWMLGGQPPHAKQNKQQPGGGKPQGVNTAAQADQAKTSKTNREKKRDAGEQHKGGAQTQKKRNQKRKRHNQPTRTQEPRRETPREEKKKKPVCEIVWMVSIHISPC